MAQTVRGFQRTPIKCLASQGVTTTKVPTVASGALHPIQLRQGSPSWNVTDNITVHLLQQLVLDSTSLPCVTSDGFTNTPFLSTMGGLPLPLIEFAEYGFLHSSNNKKQFPGNEGRKVSWDSAFKSLLIPRAASKKRASERVSPGLERFQTHKIKNVRGFL